MFRAFVLGLSVSLMILGLEGLAVESVLLAPPELLHGSITQPIRVQITELAAWLAIGVGTSLTIYTIFSRKPSNKNPTPIEINTSPSAKLHLADLDYYEPDGHSATIGEATERTEEDYEDEIDESDEVYDDSEYDDGELENELEEAEDEEDSIEEEDSSDEFDLDAFNAEFDIDDLLNE